MLSRSSSTFDATLCANLIMSIAAEAAPASTGRTGVVTTQIECGSSAALPGHAAGSRRARKEG
eukprot:3981344-Karenia_brevis.AAC.1